MIQTKSHLKFVEGKKEERKKEGREGGGRK